MKWYLLYSSSTGKALSESAFIESSLLYFTFAEARHYVGSTPGRETIGGYSYE